MSNYTSVESIFVAALQRQTPAERAAYLDAACGDDAELRRGVERLLAAHPRAVNFLEQPAAAGFAATGTLAPGEPAALATSDEPPAAADPLGEQPGDSVGPYKLLQKLGEGGMGAVWVAEQQQPIRRRVALKLIKPGMDSRQVITRFEQERQALAMMDHTHIAKVLDAGTTPQGRPYFVMELVKGVPITKYCDELHLSIRERLELFVPVCQAVQHAHQKGVIHRDIKPSNVLVAIQDGKPVPKIIDFGVAKALHTKLAERTLYTEIGAVIGTLEYMAPEQAELSALDIDTRADVYALGVLLYELLTGSTPLDRQRLRTVALDEVLRLIREEEPPKPSTRLTQSTESLTGLAAKRRADPRRLGAEVRGELDWIVMKALEKDRTRRYETANGFARDVQHFLADEAVEACPPSAGYRVRKFIRRHRTPMLGAAAVLLTLVAGTVVSTWQAVRATRAETQTRAERDAADAERDAARAARAEAGAERDRAEAARALANRNFQKASSAVEAYLQKVADSAELKGVVFRHLRKQLLEAALPFFEEFVKEMSDDPKVRYDQVKAYERLAILRRQMDEREAALRDYTTARDIAAKLVADFPAVPDYRYELAMCYTSVGYQLHQYLKIQTGVEEAFRQALTIREELVADYPGRPEYRMSLSNSRWSLGNLLADRGKWTEADAHFHKMLGIREKLTAEFPNVPDYRNALAVAYGAVGLNSMNVWRRPADAEAPFRQELVIREKLVADFPTVTAYRKDLAINNSRLADVLDRLGKPAEADQYSRQALAITEGLASQFPDVHDHQRDLALSYGQLRRRLESRGEQAEAMAAQRRALAILEKLVTDFPAIPDYRGDLASNYNRLGRLLTDVGQLDEADAAQSRALAIWEKLVADFPAVAYYRNHLGLGYSVLGRKLNNLGKQAEAEAAHRRALAVTEKLVTDFPDVSSYHEQLAQRQNDVGRALSDLGKSAEAEELFRQAIAGFEKLVADHPTTLIYRVTLAQSHRNMGDYFLRRSDPATALDRYTKAIAVLEPVHAKDSEGGNIQNVLRTAHWQCANALRWLGRYAEAVQEYERVLALDNGSNRAQLSVLLATVKAVQTGDFALALAEAKELTRGDNVAAGPLYTAARVYALASADAKSDAATQESHAVEAIALLRRAQAADYFQGGNHVEDLKTDPDFAALRGRADFQALLKELEAKK